MQKALVLFAAMLAVTVAQSANLTGLGSSADVYAILVHGTDVYVGGSFGSPFNNLAKFNTLTGNFTAVANGSYYSVYSLAIRNNELFIGASGTVLSSGDYGFNRINLTTGTWAPVAPGYLGGGTVYGIAIAGNDVIIASSSSPRLTHYINNTYFYPDFTNNTYLFNDYARGVRNINGTVYAFGDFTTPCSRVARWNATIGNWTCVSSQTLDSYAFSIAGDGTNLFVGGQFSEGLVMYNQSNGGWSAISAQIFNDDVYALQLYAGALYAGGSFTNYIYKLSLTTGLANITTGVDNTVRAFDNDASYLYIGGNFEYGIQRVSFGGSNPTPASTVTGTSTENSSNKVSATVALLFLVLIALFAF